MTATFETFECPPINQVWENRPLQHPLNTRRPPTVMVATPVPYGERHFYGPNRPEQTGEELSHGFRTSAFSAESRNILLIETKLRTFMPSAEIASPNLVSTTRP